MDNEINDLLIIRNLINKNNYEKILNYLPMKLKFLISNAILDFDYNLIITKDEIDVIKSNISPQLYLKLIFINKIKTLKCFDISNFKIDTNNKLNLLKEIIKNKQIETILLNNCIIIDELTKSDLVCFKYTNIDISNISSFLISKLSLHNIKCLISNYIFSY